MATLHFTWYLHDNGDEYFGNQLGDYWTQVEEPDLLTDELRQRLNNYKTGNTNPYYEVTLKCALDTETLEVKILEASL